MAFLSPDAFSTFRRGEPSLSLLGDKGTVGCDVFRRSEPAVSILEVQVTNVVGTVSDTPPIIGGFGAC